MTSPSSYIPPDLTSFIGRSREIGELIRLTKTSRLVTVIGTAGCGKTRLAKRVIMEVKREFPDGVFWIELAGLDQPEHVIQTLTRTLEIREQPRESWLDSLLAALQNRELMIALDNCEHLLGACAQLTKALLRAPGVKILATSREPLGVTGELRYPLSPLGLSPVSASIQEMQAYDAIQLFIERTRAILPGFDMTVENAGAVAKLCRKLDGIPLAIELASARLNVLAVEQIAGMLEDQLELPISGAQAILSHHRGLRAAVDWSFDLLTTSEKSLFVRLSVFAGGCSLEAVEIICNYDDVEQGQFLNLLSSLVDKSLVVAQTLLGSEARYSLLKTIRQYAKEKMIASGEWSGVRDRHLNYFLHKTEDAFPKLSGPYQVLWLNWLEGEYENIRAALAWSIESGQFEKGLRITNAIYPFWTIRDYAGEGLEWVEQLLAKADEKLSPVVLANALAYAAFLSGFRGNIPEQIRYGEEAGVISLAVGDSDKQALAWALTAEAFGRRAAGDHHAEFAINKRIIQLQKELGNRYLLGIVLSTTSFTAMSLGEYEEAHAMLDEALPILREFGNPYRIAMALNFSGDLARCERDYQKAQAFYEEGIALLRELEAPRDLASLLQNLGHACLHLGDIKRASALFNESLDLQTAQRNIPGIAESLIGFAALAVSHGLPEAAARLLAAVEKIGGPQVTITWAATRLEYEHNLALIKDRLTRPEYEEEGVEGRKMAVEEAVNYAQDILAKAAAAHKVQKKSYGLTVREREVAALIGQGKSNDEIANDLMISKRTIETHIANIRSKLGFDKRTQIVRWAIENGLVK
jgi:predicted ATPase/DNA-binding CsgD family transcriptional regulator